MVPRTHLTTRATTTICLALCVGGLAAGSALAATPPGPVPPLGGWSPPRPTYQAPLLPPGPALTWQALAGPDATTLGYATPTIVIRPGDSLDFTAADALPHTLTSRLTRPDGNPLFGSTSVRLGATAPVRGVESLPPGTYSFYCTIHPEMTGSLIVAG